MQQLPHNQWLTRDVILASAMPESVKQWLCHLESMTQLIKQHSASGFNLVVLKESVTTASEAEKSILGLPENSAYIREIVMQSGGVNWLYARSVFPQQIITSADQTLSTLGTNPLGSLFFTEHTKVESNPRQHIEIGLLDENNELLVPESFPETTQAPLFARRSLFNYQDIPVLVQEVFLPQHPIYRL